MSYPYTPFVQRAGLASNYTHITGTDTKTSTISAGAISVYGLLCASTTSGKFQIMDGTNTAVGQITATAGQNYYFPCITGTACYVVTEGTIDATLFWD